MYMVGVIGNVVKLMNCQFFFFFFTLKLIFAVRQLLELSGKVVIL